MFYSPTRARTCSNDDSKISVPFESSKRSAFSHDVDSFSSGNRAHANRAHGYLVGDEKKTFFQWM